jgi:hypothetical protein
LKTLDETTSANLLFKLSMELFRKMTTEYTAGDLENCSVVKIVKECKQTCLKQAVFSAVEYTGTQLDIIDSMSNFK